nr:hypothetical protein [uncultured Flavobacterium sp.]
MINTNHHTVLISFKNTTEKKIFNTTIQSSEQLKDFLKADNKYFKVDKILLFDNTQNKFKTTNKNFLKSLFSYNLELLELLNLV